MWATATVVWTALFLVLYFVQVHRDDDSPAWWYVVVVCLAAVLTLPAAIRGPGNRQVQPLLGALVIYVIAALAGGLTVGPVLIPAIAGAVIATLNAGREPVGE